MAAAARIDQAKRTVEVNRVALIEALKENREKHIKEYEEAMAGYKSRLLESIDSAFEEAKCSLEKQYEKTVEKVRNLTDDDIAKQSDFMTLVDSVTVEMKVPRSYASEYDAAIDVAMWDVRETLELSHAEFTCFVRDSWEWKSRFEAVSAMYKAAM